MIPTLIEGLKQRGYHARIVSIDRLHDLRTEIEHRHEAGHFDAAFAAYLDTQLDFELPEDARDARSLIVVAVSDPLVQFGFSSNGSQTRLLVPPTYLHWQRSDGRVQAALTELLKPHGYRVTLAALPKKLLAVRSGLAEYGTNNIAYVAGLGSFVRFSVFYSDLPCRNDEWREATIMARCRDCSACRNICPTGAIPTDGFLLRADLCTTFHNERPADVEFPSWLDASCHNCLVGCLHCQRVCPENRDVVGWIEDGAEFSAQETALLMQGIPLERLPAETLDKIERWDLTELVELFPRNLKVLLEAGA